MLEATEKTAALGAMLEMIGHDKRVLDIGCGSIELAQALKERGCTLFGIVKAGDSAAEASGAFAHLFQADLDFQSLTDAVGAERFDTVLTGDLLERLHDPWTVLDAARKLLSDGGFVVVHVRNSAHGAIQLAELAGIEYSAFGILDGSQLRFFTRDTVEQLFIRSGYRLDRVETSTVPLFAPHPLLPQIAEDQFDAAAIAAVRADRDVDTFEFVARAEPLDDAAKDAQLQRQYAAAASKLSGVQTALREAKSQVTDLRSSAASETVRLKARVSELDQLRARAADAGRELADKLEREQKRYGEEKNANAELRRAFAALAERYDALSIERRTVDAECLRLAEATASARGQMLAAQRELHAYFAPLADRVGSVESAIGRQHGVAHLERGVPVLLAQIESLDRRLRANERALRNQPLQQLSDGFAKALKRPGR